MQRQVGLLLAVLALGAPLLSEINHSLRQVIFIGVVVVVVVGVVAVRCRWEKREVGLPRGKNKKKTMRKEL